MRSTVNIRGDLESYVLRQSQISGMTVPNIIVNLAVSGMEYKEGLKSFSSLAAALENLSLGDSEVDVDVKKKQV